MLQVVTLICFLLAMVLFLLAGLGQPSTKYSLSNFGLLALTLGLALALRVFGP
jgi:hypothetical protein